MEGLITKKIILTEKELYNLILETYNDGFKYCGEKDQICKKHGNSQNKDVMTYTRIKIKELIGEKQ